MCFPLDFGCLAKAGAGAVASKVTNSFLDEVRKSAADATTTILKTLGTFWLNIPSPKVSNLAGPELTGAAAPTNLQAVGGGGGVAGQFGVSDDPGRGGRVGRVWCQVGDHRPLGAWLGGGEDVGAPDRGDRRRRWDRRYFDQGR